MLASGKSTVNLNDILKKVSEGDILSHYFNISTIPCVINSPLRKDSNPSFSIYTKNGINIKYKDFATKESGGTFDLLQKYWNCNFQNCLIRINNDIIHNNKVQYKISKPNKVSYNTNSNIKLESKIRKWEKHDIEYWKSYGISIKWLKFAEVYPISHKIIIKDDKKYVFGADKYAYTFIEKKEGKVTQKIYQPYNKNGYKWSNKNDGSVIGLWTKLPKKGDKVCICSSLKDSLCLWSNMAIPSIYLQGEGYSMSNTAVSELKKRFDTIFVLFDNDEPGLIDSKKLCDETGFVNLTLPNICNKKDISDLYKYLGKNLFIETIKPLFFPSNYDDIYSDLPF